MTCVEGDDPQHASDEVVDNHGEELEEREQS
jgi:hypothetical protein